MSDQAKLITLDEHKAQESVALASSLKKRDALASALKTMTKNHFAQLYADAQRKINGPLFDNGADTVMPTDEFMPLHVDAASDALVQQMAKEYAQSLDAFQLDFQRRWIPKMTDQLILAVFSSEHAIPDIVYREMMSHINN